MHRFPVLVALLLMTTLAGCLSPSAPQGSPYAGLEASEVRGLTAEEIEGLRSGAGMGLARPAEVNGWPGPLHALELAEALGLDESQRHALRVLRNDMLVEAVPLGERIVGLHARLESGFRDGSMDEARLRAEVTELDAAYGELRFVHLRTHLGALDLFTPDQRHEYMRLRGYTTEGAAGHGHGAGHA